MKIIFSIAFFFFSVATSAQRNSASMKDLKGLQGNWGGQLTYTDYSDDKKQVTLPTTLAIVDMNDSIGLSFIYTEPTGKTVTEKSSMRIYEDGKNMSYEGKGYDIDAVRRNGERLTIIIETEGTDNNKTADIRFTFIIGPAVFNIQKQVKYEGTEKYFTRNTLQFTKK